MTEKKKDTFENLREGISWELLSKYRTELMGCSILGIILFHWYENCMNHGKTMSMILSICSLGNRFVDAFLILSGIGLYYSFKKNDNVLQFYIRRLIKLLPAYCILAIPYWIYYDLFFAKKTIYNVIIDFSFVSFITEGNRRFWFIGLIIVLYLLFPLFYKIIYGSKNIWIGMGSLLLLYLVLSGAIWKYFPDVYSNIEIALGRVLGFMTGVFLGETVYKKRKNLVECFAGICAGLVMIMMISHKISHPLAANIINRGVLGIFFALFFLIALVLAMNLLKNVGIYENYIRKILLFLGKITMEVYILHVAFRSIFNYPAEVLRYAALIGMAILIAYPVNRISGMIAKKLVG